MNFLLTSFFTNLHEPIPLLPTRGVVLDNPRTPTEVEVVNDLVVRAVSLDSGYTDSMLPGVAIHATWPTGLDKIRETTRAAVVDDKIPKRNGLEFMEAVALAAAPELVICRFDDESAYQDWEQARADLAPNAFIMLADDNPLLVRSREAYEVGHLLALLTTDLDNEGTYRDSFILDDSPNWSVELGERVRHCLINQCIVRIRDRDASGTGFQFAHLGHYRDRLESAGQFLEARLDMDDLGGRILFASQLLSIARASRDLRTTLVNLVALLELLVARNPDSSRFNVEDSLTKQFVLKLGVLLHHDHSTRDLEQTSRALRELYGLRSLIAHGEFHAIEQHLERSSFAEPDDSGDGVSVETLRLESACEFAYAAARVALWCEIKDPKFMAFLKAS